MRILEKVKLNDRSVILEASLIGSYPILRFGIFGVESPEPLTLEDQASISRWKEFTSEPRNRLSQVLTLVTDGSPPNLPDFVASLFDLCPKTRRLIFTNMLFKDLPSHQPLESVLPNGKEGGQPIPDLEEIILEFMDSPQDDLREQVMDLREWGTAAFQDIHASRRSAGAVPLRLLSFRVFTERVVVNNSVDEYQMTDGGVLRVEMIRTPETYRFPRLKSDLWAP